MSKPKDGGQAFPRAGYEGLASIEDSKDGMTLRDYFAAKALQGMLASESSGVGMTPEVHPVDTWHQRVAERCYYFADAMLKARSTT